MPRKCSVALFTLFLWTLASLIFESASAQKRPQPRPSAPPRSTASKPAPMTNRDVIRLAQAKVGDDIIIAKINQSKTGFDLSTDGIVQLKTAGVSEAVLKAMMNAPAGADPAKAPPAQTASQPEPARSSAQQPAKPDNKAAKDLSTPPANKALEAVATGKPGAFVIRPKPTPAPPRSVIRSAPQSFGMYIEVGGQLKPVGRIQTKVQSSKWRSIVGSRVPFIPRGIRMVCCTNSS